jgi:DNA repair exonuclease SbcCD ATPase subunit
MTTSPTSTWTSNSINADGVAFAAVQGLSQELDETQAELVDARAELDEKDERIDDLERENAALEARLAAVEEHLGMGGEHADNDYSHCLPPLATPVDGDRP